jgi:hypothetical protein
MFLVECGRKWNTVEMLAEPAVEPTSNFDRHMKKTI